MKSHLFFATSLLARLGLTAAPFETRPEGVEYIWTKLSQTDPQSTIDLTIAVSNAKDASFEKLFYQIATPHSGRYRKHLSSTELAELNEPSKADVQKVRHWLSSNGITTSVQNHDLVEATVLVSQAQRLLNTTFFDYHDDEGRIVSRAEEYFVPSDVGNVIEFVHPTVNFPFHKPTPTIGKAQEEVSLVQDKRDNNPCNQGYYITPACLRSFYKVDYYPPDNTNVTMWNYLVYGHAVNASDVQIYLEHYNPAAAKANYTLNTTHIGPLESKPILGLGSEEALDAQMMMGNGFPIKPSYTYIGGKAGEYIWGPFASAKPIPPQQAHKYEEPYVNYLHSLAHDDFVPAALTSSAYQNEATLTTSYERYICKLWGQLGARGVSVFFASGDNGSGGIHRKGQAAKVFPSFNSGCPFTTSVSATIYINGSELAVTPKTSEVLRPEGKFTFGFSSGGGFSTVFDRPSYQSAMVDAYVRDHNLTDRFKNVTYFNSTGRGYPDVAVFGSRLPMISDGHVVQTGGTSASSPTMAAFISLLNAYEESKGRPPLGFLNPWFYSHPEMFSDITQGGTNEQGNRTLFAGLGYPVTKGWDAVTGLGSLKFDVMKDKLDKMAADGALE